MVAAALLSVGAPPAARAANIFWDTDITAGAAGGSGIWTDSGNAYWFNAGASTTITGDGVTADYSFTGNDYAYFTGTGAEVALGSDITLGGLVFTGITAATRNDYKISGSNKLTFATPSGSRSPSLRVDFGYRATLAVEVSGVSGLTKTGNGTLVLTNDANSITGPIVVKGGALVVTADGQLGGGSAPVQVVGYGNTGSPGFSGGSLVVQGTSVDALGGITINREITGSGRGPGAINNTASVISIGQNVFAGGITFGGSGDSRIFATHGNTRISGDFVIGGQVNNVLNGDGNFIVSGQLVGTDTSGDRFIKVGRMYGSTLWLQNANSQFNGQIRIDNGTVRVATGSALGKNVSSSALDMNNGTLEVRSDAYASGFSSVNANVRNNSSGTFFFDHALDSSAVGDVFTFGNLSRGTGGNTTNFNFSTRNGIGVIVNGFAGVVGVTSSTGAAQDSANTNFNNNGNGLLTIGGTGVWNTNATSARPLTIAGNADTLILGDILANASQAHTFTKNNPGVLTLGAGSDASTYVGVTTINAGTLVVTNLGGINSSASLAIGNATTTAGTFTYVGAAATFAKPITINTTTANAYINASGSGALTISGAITNGVGVGGAHTIVFGGTNTADNTLTSPITAGVAGITSLQKIGTGTWLFNPTGSNLFTGSTTVSDGTLKLQEVAANYDLLPDGGAVIFNVDAFSYAAGGRLSYLGANANSSTETAGALTPTAGHGIVQVTAGAGGTAAFTFASIGTRGAGATLDLSVGTGGSVIFTAAPAGTNGILGGWATYNGVNWVAPGIAASAATAYAGYTVGLPASASVATTNYLSNADVTTTAAQSVNSLKIAGAQTITLGGVLTNTSGGVLFDNSTGAATITGSQLGAAASEVIVIANGTTPANALTISSLVSGTTGSLTKSGNGLVILTAANAFTGAVNLNSGTLQLSGTAATLGAPASGNLTLRQGATFDVNGAGTAATIFTNGPSVARVLTGTLAGTGTVTNSGGGAATAVALDVGNGNANGSFYGLLSDGAGKLTLVKSGTGTQSIIGNQTFTGGTVLRSGLLAVTSLANIGQPSSLGAGDATSDATNAASLIFAGGTLRYTGAQGTGYDNAVINIFKADQTPSVAIDRLFTLAGDATIQSNGMYGTNVQLGASRVNNNAAIVFTNTAPVAFLGSGDRTLNLAGDGSGDNAIFLRLVDNPNGGKLNILRSGWSSYWTLGNTNNTYTGYTQISGGAIVAVDGASLPVTSNLQFSQDWAGGSFFQSSGTFNRTIGTGTANSQWQAGPKTGFAGFAADRSKLIVDWTGQNLVWGNATGTANFLKGSTFSLNSGLSLADLELKGDFEIQTNADTSAFTITTTAGSSTVKIITGDASLLSVGQKITGAGIPAGAYIAGFNTANEFTLNTGTGVTAVTASPASASGGGWRDISIGDNGNTGLDFVSITGVISGNGNLSKQGGGLLFLGNANTYTGNTILRNEGLVVTSIGAAGATSSSLGANSGSYLEMGYPGGTNATTLMYVGPGETATRPLYLTGSSGDRRISADGSGPLILTDIRNRTDLTNTPNTTAQTKNLVFRGVNTDFNMVTSVLTNEVGGGGGVLTVYKQDGGTWVLNPATANTFTGVLRAEGGLLGLTANGIGSAASLRLGNGGVFAYGGDLVITKGITLGNNATSTFAGSNNIAFGTVGTPITVTTEAGDNDQTFTNNLDSGKVLTAYATLASGKNNTNSRTFNIRGNGSTVWVGAITKQATSTGLASINIEIDPNASFTMAGAANTFDGDLVLTQGTLILDKASAFGASKRIQFNGGVMQANQAQAFVGTDATGGLIFNGEHATFAGTSSFSFTGKTVNWGGNRYMINNLSGGATLTLNNLDISQDGTGRIWVPMGSGITNVTGVVANGSTATSGQIYYRGTGQLNFSGANTITRLLYQRGSGKLDGAAGSFNSLNATLGEGLQIQSGASFTVDNSVNNLATRIGDTSVLSLEGGAFNYVSNAANSTESMGALRAYGNAAITLSGAGTGTLTLSAMDYVFYADPRSSLNVSGTTSLGTSNKIKFSNLAPGFQPKFLVGDGKLGAYDATNGIVEFTGFAVGTDLNATAASDVVRVDAAYGADDIAIDRTLRGLLVSDTTARTLTSSGNATLTVSSGAVSAAGLTTHVLSVPRLSFVVSTPATMSTLASGNVVSIGDTSRLAVGQMVSGTNIPTNSFITEIINGTSFRINNATTTAGSGNVLTAYAPAFFNVATGTTLDLQSAVISNSDVTKAGAGTLLMSRRQYFGGQMSVLDGTLKMNAGDNTLWSGLGVTLNVETLGTLDLNGTTLFVNGLQSLSNYTGSAGTITSSTGTGTLVVSSTGARSYFGTIAGANVNFAKLAGSSTQTFYAPLTYGGKTFLSGNGMTLTDNATLLNTSQIDISYGLLTVENNNNIRVQTNRLSDTAPLNLRGGALTVNMQNRLYASERVGVINALEGDSYLNITSGGGTFWSADLLSPALNRSTGTTVNFNGSGRLGQPALAGRIFFDTPIVPASTRGLIGAWAIANSNDYAAYTPELGVGIVGDGGFVGYDATFGAGNITELVVVTDSTTTLPGGGASAAVLKLAGTAFNGVAFAAPGDTLTLGLGGLLRSNNSNSARIGTVATRGVLTSGTNELIVYSAATGTATQAGNAVTSTTLGSTTLRLVSTTGIVPGMMIGGTNLVTGVHTLTHAYVQEVLNATDVRVSIAATGTGAGATYTYGASSVVIDSVIADNGVANTVKLVKAGPGTVVLTAPNTFTGGTIVNSGELQVNPTTPGDVVIPAGGLTINGGWGGQNFTIVNINASGALAASTDVTINGSGRLAYAPGTTNTLNSITFNNSGGEYAGVGLSTVYVGTNSILNLTGSAPITATSSNTRVTSTLTDSRVIMTSGAKTFAVDGIKVFGSSTPLTSVVPTLNIASILTGINVSVTKTGDGLLQLSGLNEFTDGLTVSGGGIILGTSSSPTQGGNGLLGGPLGTGTVTMASGTRLLIDNADRQVGNDIAFQGTPIFDINASGTVRTMTLNGELTGIADGTPTIQVNSPWLTVALLGTIPNIANITSFNKTGLGRLIFNATGYTGDFNATALGFSTAISLLADGNGNGAPEAIVLPGNVVFDAGIAPNITVGRAGGTLPYGQASHKTIQAASVSNLGLGLTVTNNNGYGLVVSDAFTAAAGSLYSVSTASYSVMTQGLTLTGKVSGASGLTKTGNGILVLANATNDFVGDLNVTRGVVSISADGQLGAAANKVVLNPTGASPTLRVTDDLTFASGGRQIKFGNASAASIIEVPAGKTLTLANAFDVSAAAAASLEKLDNGILAVAVANPSWTGGIKIRAGAVLLSVGNGLGTGTIDIPTSGIISGQTQVSSGQLQLIGGITVPNTITMGISGSAINSGLNYDGIIRSVSGVNTLSGGITHVNGTGTIWGADVGAELVFAGVLAMTNSPSFTGGGTFTFNAAPTQALNTFNVIGGSRVNFNVNVSALTPSVNVRNGTLAIQGATGRLSGDTTSVLEVFSGSTLIVDNTAAALAARLGNRELRLTGGTFNYVANAGAASSEVSTRNLSVYNGASTINVINAGSQATTLQWAGLSMTNGGATVNLTGSFGTATNILKFVTPPTLSPATVGILPRFTANANEFVTYTATDGLKTFAGYSSAVNILSAGSAAIYKATPTTANSLSGNQTIVALNLNTGSGSISVGGLGGLNPSVLTISSGAVLVNGTGTVATLAVPVVALGAEGIFHVASGQTLTVTSGITGGSGFTKSLGGAVNFDGLQFYTGTTYVNDGTLRFKENAANTLLPNNNLMLSDGATVDLFGGAQYVQNLLSVGAGSAIVAKSGTITNSGSQQAVLVANANSSYSGGITGDIYFSKTGGNNLNIGKPLTYTGPTLISGGTLTIGDEATLLGTSAITLERGQLTIQNNSSVDLANRISDTAPITLKGGTLQFVGHSGLFSTESVGAVTLGNGYNYFAVDDGGGSTYSISTGTLTLASLTRTAGSGAVLRMNNLGELGQLGRSHGRIIVTSAPTLTNGILGPWAIVDRVFASYDPVYGLGGVDRAGFPGFAGSGLNSLPADTDNVYTTQTGLVPMLADTAVGTLTINIGDADATYDLGGNTLRLRNGGLMLGSNNGNRLLTVTNGNVTAGVVGSAAELYLWHAPYGDDGRRGWFAANVVDNDASGPVRLIVSGADSRQLHSSLTLAGQNTNTGGTVFNSSTIVLDPAARLGTGGIVVNGGQLRQVASNTLFRIPGSTFTAGSNVVTVASTSGLAVGMPVWGVGSGNGNQFITEVTNGTTFKITDGTNITAGTVSLYALTNVYGSGNGAVIPEQSMQLNGGATVYLTGANRLTSLVFENGGGNGMNLYNTGVLTLTSGISATSTNAVNTATIASGTIDLNAAPAFPVSVGAISIAGRDVAPWVASLVVNAVLQNGGITKTGNGLLQLGAQSTFTGGVNVTGGGLIIGANSTAVSGTFTGPFGDGTVTMVTGTRLLSTAAYAVQNAFVFGDNGSGTGSTVFGGLNNITLSGSATIPSVQWNVEVTAPQTTVSIADILGESPTTVIRKSGLGFLNVGGFDGSIEATGGLSITADGNARGTVQALAVGGDVTVTDDLSVTVNRSGSAPFARNKVIQKGNLTVPGNILSVSNISGYGLEFTGTTTMTGPSHFAVGTATASNVPQGLILSGVVDDGANTFGLIKSGPGTLVLGGVNTFGGATMTVDILGGVLSVNSDAALGDALNTVTLNADGQTAVGFRATETFFSARSFILNQANNAFEVTAGKVLTLNQPFLLGGSATRVLAKNDNGVLNLSADNTGWAGTLNINAGAVRLSNNNAAGTSAINIAPNSNALGAALELAGGVTIANAISLQGNNNQLLAGLDFGGQLSNFSGNNTVSGAITTPFDAVIGAKAGSSLSLTGGVQLVTKSSQLWFDAVGDITLAGTKLSYGAGVTEFYSIQKYGTGNLNITNVQDALVNSGQWFMARQGNVVLSGDGTWKSQVYLDQGTKLIIDESAVTASGGAHTTANGRLATSLATAANMAFRGAELYIRGSQTVSDGLSEFIGTPTFARGASTITLEMNRANYIRLAFNGSPGALANAQNNTTGPTGASVLFRGKNFGVSNDPDNSNVIFAGGVSFNGQGGASGATNKAILPWALVGRTDQAGNEEGYSFATVSNGGGGGTNLSGDRIVRPLGASEYSLPNIATGLDNNNLQFTANVTTTLVANAVPNSLTIEGGADITLADGVRLSLSSGGVLVRNGSTSVLSGGVLNQTNGYSPLNLWVVGNAQLTVNSAMNGGNGLANGAISAVKAGAGTLVIAPPTSQINGLLGLGTNALSGQFVINQGTVKLGTGIKNAVMANNYLALTAGVLDLNGNIQQTYSLFADQAWANANGTITSSSGTGSLIVNQDNSARNWAGSITGDVRFTKQGQSNLTLYSNQAYTNTSLFNGGNVILRDEAAFAGTSGVTIQYGGLYLDSTTSTQNLNDRLNDAAAITMRGGVLELRGRQQTATVESVGAVSLLDGQSQINVSNGGTNIASTQLNLATLSRPAGGGTINFTGATGQAGSAARVTIGTLNGADASVVGGGLNNGIIGGWAVIGTSDFASYIPGLGVAALGSLGFEAYAPATVITNTTLATDNIKLNTGLSTVSAAVTVNSIATSNVAVGTVNITAGNTLTVGSGGVLSFTNTSWSIGTAPNVGSLTSGAGELFLYAQGSGVLTVNSRITGNIGVVKFGANSVALAGLNTYTGGTTFNQGTLTVNAGSVIPAATDPLKGLILNNVGLTTTFAAAVAPANIVTLNAGGAITYFGDNTQAGFVINNLGGTGTPTVRTYNTTSLAGALGVLTVGASGLTATSANVGTTAVIEGRVDFGATAKTISVSAIDINGATDVAPLAASLILQGIVGSFGGITKTGNGVLQLNGQASFTGDFNVNAGGLKIGVAQAGSRFSRLTLAANTRLDLNNQNTTWGSLAGSGDVFSSGFTPTLAFGFDNTSSTFSGRFIRFNDAAYALLNKVGTGQLTLNTAQDANGSWGAFSINGGSVVYADAGKAFQAPNTASAATFNVNPAGVLSLSNAAVAANHRLGMSVAGTLAVQGGRFLLDGNASAAVAETVTNLNVTNGGGRIELSPVAGQNLLFTAKTLSGGNNTGTLVIGGLTGNADGAGVANVAIGNVNYINAAQQGVLGLLTGNGSTNMIVRGDILADASATGLGTGFLVRDTVALSATMTNNSATISVPSTAGILVGASVTAVAGIPANSFVTAVDAVLNTVTINNGTGVAPQTATLYFGNYFRPLADSELNLTPRGALGDNVGGWAQGQNAGVSSAVALNADTVVNTLTFSGTASLGSGLGSSFGRFGPGGSLLTQKFTGATAFLVKSGTTTLDVGSFTSGTGTTLIGHVLAGATLNVNSTFGIGQSSGFVKADGGVMNLNALAYFQGGSFTVNGGVMNLNSGLANTVAVMEGSGAVGASTLNLNGQFAVVDLKNQAQAFNAIQSTNTLAGQGGTLTNTGASLVNLTSIGGGTFGGTIAGKINFVRTGNNTTTLTNASTYTGETIVRGGTLTLIDSGALTATSAIKAFYGTVNWDNLGLNPLAASLPTRIPSTAPISLQGANLTIGGTASADTVATFNTLNILAGANTLQSTAFIGGGATTRINVGNLVRTAADRPTMNFQGWSTRNSGGTNTIGQIGLNASSLIYLSKVNGTAYTAASTVNGIIGGWAIASGDTFATYSDTYGVGQMGTTNATAFTTGLLSDATVATGNYSDGTTAISITGAKVANSWRMAPGAAQTITFSAGASLTLGAGIVTNANQTITLAATDATNTVTVAGTGDLYTWINQGTTIIQPKLTGSMALVNFGGATLRLEPKYASNDYVGGTFANGGTLNLNATATFTAVPSGNRYFTAATLNPLSAVVTLATTDGLVVGSTINNPNFPAGTTVQSVDSATQVTLSVASTNAAVVSTAQTLRSNAVNASLADFVGLTIHGSTVTMGAALNQIDPATNVLIKGNGRLLFADYANLVAGTDFVQTLRSVTFVNEGGSGNTDFGLGNPNDVAAFSKVVLSGLTPVTSTNNSMATIPSLYTGDAARTRLEFSAASPIININAGQAMVGLNLGAPIGQHVGMTGPIQKQGAGILALTSADSVFTTGVDLQAGGIMIGASSDAATPTKGPLGIGTFTIGNGTTILTDNAARTLHNPIVVNGDFTVGGRNVGAALTLSGAINLGATAKTITFASPAITTTINGTLTTTVAAGSTGLTKSGEGILQLGNTSTLNFGGAGLTIAGGVIKAGKADNIPASTLLTVNAGAGYDLMGLAQTSDAIAGAGFITNSANQEAVLTLSAPVDFSFAGVIADNRANVLTPFSATKLVKNGGGNVTLTGANTYVGTTSIEGGGKITVGNGGSLGTGTINIGAGVLEYARTDSFTLANTFDGTGALNFVGVGGVAKVIGDSTATSLAVTVTGSSLQLGDNGATGKLEAVSVNLRDGAILRFARTGTLVFNSNISSGVLNDGVLEQVGTGTTKLTFGNSFSGDVSITAGELEAAGTRSLEYARQIVIGSAGSFRVSSDDALGFGPGPNVILNGGLMRFLADGNNSALGAVHDLVLNGGTVISGTVTSGGNSLYLTGALTVTNDATISAKDIGFVNTFALSSSPSGVATDINVANGKTLTISGTIADDISNYSSSFNKKGTGTMILGGDNAEMSGQVIVSAGTVVVNDANALGNRKLDTMNTFLANAVTVNSGARVVSNTNTFVAAAPIATSITLNSGASLGVGSAIGNLQTSALVLNGGAFIEFKIWDVTQGAGLGYDMLDLGVLNLSQASSANRIKIKLISMNTATTLGNAVNLNLPTNPSNFGTFDFGTFDYVNSTGYVGNISDVFSFDTSQFTYTGGSASDAGLWSINFDTNSGAVTLTAVPEPSTYGFGLGALALAAAAIRRRRRQEKKA
jgi:autotransporter-associated beta strand protein